MRTTKTVNLIKYGNRKLYSPKGELKEKASYIRHQDVIDCIKDGYDVNIRNKHGFDVTNEVLKKLLSEVEVDNAKLVSIIRG